MKKIASLIFGCAVIGTIGWGVYWIVSQIWGQFRILDPKVSAGLLTAATTVIVATLTVVLGKYFERKKDIKTHYREKKTEIYDEFLCEFFKLYYSDDNKPEENTELVDFLREWQRKMILWGGQDVLLKYVDWMGHLKKGNPDAKTMFMMERFFLEIRKDLGHKNNKLIKGTLIHLILRNPELFMAMSKKDPDLTLAELSEIERGLQG